MLPILDRLEIVFLTGKYILRLQLLNIQGGHPPQSAQMKEFLLDFNIVTHNEKLVLEISSKKYNFLRLIHNDYILNYIEMFA